MVGDLSPGLSFHASYFFLVQETLSLDSGVCIE